MNAVMKQMFAGIRKVIETIIGSMAGFLCGWLAAWCVVALLMYLGFLHRW